MLMMIAAMLILPGMDAIAKWLSSSIGALQAVWFRFVVQVLLLAPLVMFGRAPLVFASFWIHPIRGALMIAGTVMFFTALRFLPLADAIAIFFVEPFIVTLMAAVFLGEKVGWRRMTAIVVGFIGALIVIRPNFEQFGWPAMLPLGAAVTFSVYLLFTRRMSQHVEPVQMQLFSGISGCLLVTVIIAAGVTLELPIVSLVAPSGIEWSLLFALGLISTVGHLLVVHALRIGSAGLLAPFQYVEIIGATLLGLLVFGDFPDALTWVGVGIIVGSGLYVFHRERALARCRH